MEERGALYVVVGSDDRYLEAAKRSAQSLREAMPGLPIAFASDRCIERSVADYHYPTSGDDGFRAKILGMRATPYEKTIFLDADTFVVDTLSDLFELLDRFDIALAHAPRRINMPVEGIPAAFPEFNTGLIAYRQTAIVSALFDAWLKNYDLLRPSNPSSKDQPSFRLAAFLEQGLRIATLTPEFNQLFEGAGYQNDKVRVLHGWPVDGDYEEVAAAMRNPTTRVFAGRRVYSEHGRLEIDFGQHRKLKRIRSALLRFL